MVRDKKWDVNDPEIRQMVEQVKWEIAAEYGIQIPRDGYYGNIVSKDLGKIGSQLQKRIPLLLEWKQKQAGQPLQKVKKRPFSTRKTK
jgi:hypothetical protein